MATASMPAPRSPPAITGPVVGAPPSELVVVAVAEDRAELASGVTVEITDPTLLVATVNALPPAEVITVPSDVATESILLAAAVASLTTPLVTSVTSDPPSGMSEMIARIPSIGGENLPFEVTTVNTLAAPDVTSPPRPADGLDKYLS